MYRNNTGGKRKKFQNRVKKSTGVKLRVPL